ncbi:MAG: J domain-containing protein [Planctomycetota bacterium]
MAELPDSNDPFEVLGVEPGADRKTIKRAYIALVKRFKPEHFPDEFQRIRAAYETLRESAAQTASLPFLDEAWQESEASQESEGVDPDCLEPPSQEPVEPISPNDARDQEEEVAADFEVEVEFREVYDSEERAEPGEDSDEPSELWSLVLEDQFEEALIGYESALAARPDETRLYFERYALDARRGESREVAQAWLILAFKNKLDICAFLRNVVPPGERPGIAVRDDWGAEDLIDHPDSFGASWIWRLRIESFLCLGKIERVARELGTARYQSLAANDDFYLGIAQRAAAVGAWYGPDAAAPIEEWALEEASGYPELLFETKAVRGDAWREHPMPDRLFRWFGVADTIYWDSSVLMADAVFADVEDRPFEYHEVLLKMAEEPEKHSFLKDVNDTLEYLVEVEDDEGGFFLDFDTGVEPPSLEVMEDALGGIPRPKSRIRVLVSTINSSGMWLYFAMIPLLIGAVFTEPYWALSDPSVRFILIIAIGIAIFRMPAAYRKYGKHDAQRLDLSTVTLEYYRRLLNVGAKPSQAREFLADRCVALRFDASQLPRIRRSQALRFLTLLYRVQKRVPDDQ